MAKKTAKKAEVSAEEKAAKKKARMEALKNRPAGQRPNGKQIDVILAEDGTVLVKKYATPVKVKLRSIGCMVTTVAFDKEGNPVAVSESFVPGNLVVKAKKGHGNLTAQKSKKEGSEAEEEEEDED